MLLGGEDLCKVNRPEGGAKVEEPTNVLCIGRLFFCLNNGRLKIETFEKNPSVVG